MPPPPWFPARLTAVRTLAPAVRELTFSREDGPLAFAAGQWVNLEIATPSGPVVRAYSIASPPNGTSEFALAITQVDGGPASTALHALRPGATLRAQGPQGDECLRRPARG